MPSIWQTLQRTARRWHRRLWPPHVDLLYTEAYSRGHSAVPYDALRGERILTFLGYEGLLPPTPVHRPRPASVQALRRVHTDDYLDSLRAPESLTKIVGVKVSDTELDDFLAVQRAMAGGTLYAAHLARTSGRLALNLAGGTHHAHADKGQGFCVFNDVAIAIASLREHGFYGRILLIDLDLHDGDGTRSIFALDDSVFTFSIHNQPWSEDHATASFSLALGSGVDDRTYLAAIEEHLPPVIEQFRPQFTFYLAGCDPAADDQIGDWKISADGMWQRDRFVYERLRHGGHRVGGHRIPTVIVLAGGYGSKAWRYSARFFGSILNRGRRLEPPSTEEITLLRYRHLSSLLDPRDLTGMQETENDWKLTEEDIYGSLAQANRQSRFLGYYSKHGLELVLERSGLLDRARAMGYRGITLDLDLDSTAGHTLRLFGDPDHRELLTELRVRRDRSTISGMELLRVEWLLLQHPRAEFTDGRTPLPGQKHPGLGMLRDVVALLVVACERLDLDGLAFVPSHYHMAVSSKKVLRFLEPEHEVIFEALRRALRHLPVAEASRAVDEGRVRDLRTGKPYEWQPVPMVLPVSRRLRERFSTDGYKRRLGEAEEKGFGFELAVGTRP